MKKKDCRRDTAKKQDSLESNGTFYCSLVKDMQTLRRSTSEALPSVSTLEGTAYWPMQLGSQSLSHTTTEPATSSCSLLVRIRRLSQLIQGLNVKERPLIDTYQSAGRTIFHISLRISTQTFSAKISLSSILQNFRDLLSIFPPGFLFQTIAYGPGISNSVKSKGLKIFPFESLPLIIVSCLRTPSLIPFTLLALRDSQLILAALCHLEKL